MSKNKNIDISVEILNKIKEKTKTLRSVNGGTSPIVERFIYVKSPEVGYVDEFGDQYLFGEYIFKTKEDDDDEDYDIVSLMERGSKHSILMLDNHAEQIFKSKKLNYNNCIKIGDVWFNGVDYLRYLNVDTGLTQVNRYLLDLFDNYSVRPFLRVKNSIDGEHLILGHIVSFVENEDKGVIRRIFKIITKDSYLIIGIIPDYESELKVGDLITFNSILTKTKNIKQSRFKYVDGLKVIESGRKIKK